MKFKASLDTPAILVTALVFVIFAICIGIQLTLTNSGNSGISLLVTIILSATYAGAFLFRPLGYEISPDAVIIQRPVKNVQIPLHSVAGVELISRDQLRYTIRTFGVGGLFGYYGRFANRTIGSMTWYATRRDRNVLLTLGNGQKILLTPDEPEQFIRALTK